MFDDRSVNYNIPIPNVANTLSVDVYNKTTIVNAGDGTFVINWKAEE